MKDVPSRRQLLATAGLLGLALGGCGEGPSATPGGAVRVAYGSDPSQFGELSLPPSSGPVPVAVVLHGGFWRTSYGLELGRPLATDLAAAGLAVWNVEYRRVGGRLPREEGGGGGPFSTDGGGGGWPATGEDVAAAIDALAGPVQQAAGGRLDLTRVVAIGHSAGGQLAVWLAARTRPRVALRGVVSQAGVLDLVFAADAGVGGTAVPSFLGGSPAERPDAYAHASPTALVPFSVPVVCVHGRSDVTVPPSQSERFVAADSAAGGRSSLQLVDGDHFDQIDVTTPAWRSAKGELLRLLG